jgi:hypothetical protein
MTMVKIWWLTWATLWVMSIAYFRDDATFWTLTALEWTAAFVAWRMLKRKERLT